MAHSCVRYMRTSIDNFHEMSSFLIYEPCEIANFNVLPISAPKSAGVHNTYPVEFLYKIFSQLEHVV